VVDAIERTRTTAKSHSRVIIVEVMGRNAGWIAAYAGIAAGADCTLVPEVPFNLNEVCELVKRRYAAGKDWAIIVAAEGAKPEDIDSNIVQSKEIDQFGHERLGGIGAYLEKEINARTGISTRTVVIGHLQRGGAPSAADRVLASRLGVKAVELISEGSFGYMAALNGEDIVPVPLEKAVGRNRRLDLKLYELVELFSGERNQ